VVVFPCGDVIGLLLNQLDLPSAAPRRRRRLGFRHMPRAAHIEPRRRLVAQELSWTNGLSCQLDLFALSSSFIKQQCKSRRKSSPCHAPRYVRIVVPFHLPFALNQAHLGPAPVSTPNRYTSCAILRAFERSGPDRGAPRGCPR
jgi:hypothetical protein